LAITASKPAPPAWPAPSSRIGKSDRLQEKLMLQSIPLTSLLRCPHCGGEYEDDTPSPRCRKCGSAYARHGSILDFLNGGGGDAEFPMPIDAYARRVVDDPVAFRDILKGGDASSRLLREMAERTDLDQVLGDTARVVGQSVAGPSPFFEFASKHLRVDGESVVLDVGASCGRHLWELKEHACCSMVALDINLIPLAIGSMAWETAGSPVCPTWVRGDALSLPFRDAVFTHVLSNVTLILLPIRRALSELYRVLRPGGRVLFTVEGSGAWRKYWDGSRPWSRRRFNLIRQRLANAMLHAGLPCQDYPVLSRLSRHSQYSQSAIERFVRRAGFSVEWCGVNKSYKEEPLVIGVVGRMP
jgi:ubiquinone/menaquinone biosynthesis C-methylase UbiE